MTASLPAPRSILSRIGNTSMLELRHVVPEGGASGSHKIEGTGAGFVVPLWNEGAADEVETVSTAEAMAMARRLAREEGIFAGTSSGGNVVAALRVAKELGPDATVVTVIVDTGLKYLSTKLYKSESGDKRR